MKRFQRSLAATAVAVMAGAGLAIAAQAPASAAILGTVNATPATGTQATPINLSVNANCPAGTAYAQFAFSGPGIPAAPGNLIPNGDFIGTGVGTFNVQIAIANYNSIVGGFTTAGTYQARFDCYSSDFSTVTDSYVRDLSWTGNPQTTGSYAFAAVNVSTITTVGVPSPASSAGGAGNPITLSAQVAAPVGTPAPTGSLTFAVAGSPAVSGPLTVAAPTSTAGNVATYTTQVTAPTVPVGDPDRTYQVTASFAGSAGFDPSQDTTPETFTIVAGTPAQATTTTITSVTGGGTPLTSGGSQAPGTTLTPVVINASVAAGGNPVPDGSGTCSFFNGATQLAANVPLTGGNCSYTSPTGFSGPVSFTAQFVSANQGAGGYTNSTSGPFTFTFLGVDICSLTTGTSPLYGTAPAAPGDATLAAPPNTPLTRTPFTGSQCTDPQTIVVTVPTGNLIISTPYTPANPFDLGTVTLNPNGTAWSISKAFGSATDPGAGVSITDTRAGNLPFTASLSGVDFAGPGGGVIPIANLGFTGLSPLYITGNRLDGLTGPTTVSTTPIPALSTSAQPFANGTGPGSVFVVGTLDLSNVATSTPPGLYTSTLTFTIA
jgi:hypothetical protein